MMRVTLVSSCSPSQPERKHCRRSSVSSKLIRGSSSSISNLNIDARKRLNKDDGNETKAWLEDLNEELLCCICRELMISAHALPCSHTFCHSCITGWLKQATDCPSCRANSTHKLLVPVKVLDNTIEKVAKKVLPLDELEQREKAIQELLDRKSGKIGEWNIEIHAEYGPTGRNRLICDKCYSPVPNRYLHWRVSSPYSGATDHYHFSCFQPHTQVTVDQIKIASKVSAKDRKRVEKKIKS
ncbi:polycomb group RING finger protein 1 isoform X3 [Nematostella vectensis]|uniref:polycomb group RING finger protein 1 isoform X3 n=1 Tax=Nematostella vectensis TaxID=45351 RepID=UPI002077827D|nr:polycomb group RING finger protein 1 isoform X3 [Nematostella vectensis]